MRIRHTHRAMDEAQDGGMQWRKPAGEIGVATIDRERVLHEVVGADAEKGHVVGQGIGAHRGRWCFDHDAERNVGAMRHAAAGKFTRRLRKEESRLTHFVDRHDEGQHDAHVAVHGGAEQCPQLRFEDFRFIETHADGAPAEERIRFVRIAANRQLVAAEVECPDDNGLSAERLEDVHIRGDLLVLIGHGGATDHKELRAHEADALSAALDAEVGLVGEIDVRAQHDVLTVGGDGLRARHRRELRRFSLLARRPNGGVRQFEGGGSRHERSGGAIKDHLVAGCQARGRIQQTDHSWQSERASENRHVRRAGARVCRDAGNAFAIDLHREARREVVRDEDRIRPLGEIDGIVIRQSHQNGQHTNVQVGQVAHAFAHHRLRRSAEVLAPLAHHDVKGPFSGEVLSHRVLHAFAQLRIREDRHLHVEDRRIGRSRGSCGVVAHVVQAAHGTLERIAQPEEFCRHVFLGDGVHRHFRYFPPEEIDGTSDDPGRRGDPME